MKASEHKEGQEGKKAQVVIIDEEVKRERRLRRLL